MRVYVEVARRAARRLTTYRSATAAGIFTNTVFGFLYAYVLQAVFVARGPVNGYDLVDALTFTFLSQGLAMPVGVFGSHTEQADRIRTGDVVVDLYRPIDYQGYWVAIDYGKAAFYVLFRGVPPFVLGALVFPLRLPPAPWVWAAFAVSVALAVAVAAGWRFLLQTSAFWLLDGRGLNQVGWMVAGFFSGMVVPLFLFPPGLAALAGALPFRAMIQVPIEVYLGRHTGADLVATLAGQAAWAVALLAAGRVVLARAVRKVVVQGG